MRSDHALLKQTSDLCVFKTLGGKNMAAKRKKDDEKTSKAVRARKETVRPELNLEKWPAIWQPAQSRNKLTEIVIERTITQPDKSKISAKVEVTANSKYGPLTTEDQKVYYTLQKLWEETARPRRIQFSRRKIAKTLGREWGANVSKAISDSLLRLRSTLFIWTDAYYDSTTKKTFKYLNTFNILSELKIVEEKTDGHTTTEDCYCEFQELIYNNLQNGYTKPLLLNTLISFEDGIAQILYTYLDLIMADKNHYERRTKELFEDLQLKGEKYIYLSCRKSVLERIFPKLQGRELSKGGILSLALAKTKDSQDYKMIVDINYQNSLHVPDKQDKQDKQDIDHEYNIFYF
jgi:hypothetical protein